MPHVCLVVLTGRRLERHVGNAAQPPRAKAEHGSKSERGRYRGGLMVCLETEVGLAASRSDKSRLDSVKPNGRFRNSSNPTAGTMTDFRLTS